MAEMGRQSTTHPPQTTQGPRRKTPTNGYNSCACYKADDANGLNNISGTTAITSHMLSCAVQQNVEQEMHVPMTLETLSDHCPPSTRQKRSWSGALEAVYLSVASYHHAFFA